MGRLSLYEDISRSGQVTETADRRNEVADAFLQVLDDTLGEVVLSGPFGCECRPEQTSLYIYKRRGTPGAPKLQKDLAYEDLFHHRYWPPFANDYPLMILQSREGVGKTTFLRYYFDHYLPHYPELAHGRGQPCDPVDWQKALMQHVVLYSDLRRGLTAPVVVGRMCADFRRQITHRFPGIGEENTYAMWERKADWTALHHKHAEEGCASKLSYRAQYISDWIRCDDLFVEEALWYLSNTRNTRGALRNFVTLICDNLDQQDPSILIHVLDLILRWLGDGVYTSLDAADDPHALRLWKVILPLRPETLRMLNHKLAPINRKDVFELGEVDYDLLLAKRAEATVAGIRATGRQVDVDHVVGPERAPVYAPIPNFVAADTMHCMLTFKMQMPKAKEAVSLRPREITKDLLEDFCNGSLRRYLRLRRRLALNVSIQEMARSLLEDRTANGHISHYAFLDGVLTNGRDHFDKNESDNDILNLYETTKQPPSPYTLLIGVHLLHLLRYRHWTARELINTLRNVGYTTAEVEDCLESMLEQALYKRGPSDRQGDYRIYPENAILNAYARLLTNPAYTDNMAMVTPVEDDIRKNMVFTSSRSAQDFMARVKTTYCFLQQIRDDELHICRWPPLSGRHVMDRHTFEESLRGLALPSTYREVARGYIERLEELKQERRVNITSRDWSTLLRDSRICFVQAEAEAPLDPIVDT